VGCHVEHTLIRETRPQSLLQKLVRARYPHTLYCISAPQGSLSSRFPQSEATRSSNGSLSSERSHQVVKVGHIADAVVNP
jgi:hypothetical protein